MNYTSTLTGLQRNLNGSRTAGGLDVIFTKLAVDLQNLNPDTAVDSIRICLDVMQEVVSCDAVCLALFDDEASSISIVHSAQSTFASCNPDHLQGEQLADWPWLSHHFAHLRLLELLDTQHAPTAAAVDAARLNKIHIASVLLIGFEVKGKRAGLLGFLRGQPTEQWDADSKLLLKLMGASLASGLEKISFRQEMAERDEMQELLTVTAHDGMWDFDATNNVIRYSPQWKAMLRYEDVDLDSQRLDWRRLIHYDDLARVQAGLREHIAGKSDVFTSVHRMRRSDGEWRWMEGVASRRSQMQMDACGGWLVSSMTSQSARFTKRLFSAKRKAPRSRCSLLGMAWLQLTQQGRLNT